MERQHPKADVGVVVGRFQVAELHDGHFELLDWVNDEHDQMVVVLGVAGQPGRKNNPLSYSLRARMIGGLYPQAILAPLADDRSDERWSEHLDALVRAILLPGQTACLYGARDSFLAHYSGRLPTQELVGDKSRAGWSGTDSRESLRVGVTHSRDFRAGAIWQAQNQWPRVDTCVDVAVFCNNNILLARKPGEDGWRLIGGFASPFSSSFADDARREVEEETGLKITRVEYVSSMQVDDWRYRGESDCIKTLLYTAMPIDSADCSKVHAQDDIAEVAWHPTRMVAKELFVPSHRPLYWELVQANKLSQVD